MPETTKAEQRARRLAEQFEKCGFEITVTVEEHAPTYYKYDPAELMLQGRVMVHVRARSASMWDDDYGFSFSSSLPAKGRRATTCYVGGTRYRGALSRRKPFINLSLKELYFRLSCEQDTARFHAERAAAKEA